jgi:hypothetical protein
MQHIHASPTWLNQHHEMAELIILSMLTVNIKIEFILTSSNNIGI